MWVLALDTSSPGGAVALLRDDEVIVDQVGDRARSHVERLPGAIAEILAAAGLAPSALDLLAVASGPGPFTALRVGLATIQGLAMALDRPTIGVPSLAAAGWRAFADDASLAACGVWLDGARGDVFAAAFARPLAPLADWPLLELVAASVTSPAETLRAWDGRLPDGAPVLLGPAARGRDEAGAAGRRVVAADAPLAVPVGRIGRRAHLAGHSGPPHGLAPLYVRRPDAEVERERRLGADVTSR